MEAHKLVIAIALLTGPDPTVDIDELTELHCMYAPMIQEVAIEWEILDPRERGHVLSNVHQFATDLAELRRRCDELAAAPLDCESQRFPDRKTVNELLMFNRHYQQELRQRLMYDNVHRGEILSALQETEMLYRIWDRVQAAQPKFYYISARRRALMELRDMIGEAAFYSGQLPPPLPLWRLPRMD